MYRLAFREPCKSALQRTVTKQNRSQCSSSNSTSPLPPNTQQAGFGKVLVLLSPFIVAGGTVTYARYDKEFRKLAGENVPGFESIVKATEDDPFKVLGQKLDAISKNIDDFKGTINSVTSKVTGLFGGSSEKEIKREAVVKEPVVKEPAPKPKTVAMNTTKKEPDTPKSVKSDVEPLPKNILELEQSVEIAAALAVKEYNNAISILSKFNEDVQKVVDLAIEKMDTTLWTSLRNKTTARDVSVQTAEDLAQKALIKIEQCQIALSKVANESNHEQIMQIRNKVMKLMSHINQVKDELYREKDMAVNSEKYWKNVEKARHYFIDEIQSILPGLNLSQKRLDLSKDDLDIFIMYAYSHILAYQKELQRLETDGELRLKRAIDAVRGEKDTEALKAQIEYRLEEAKRNMSIENQKKIFQLQIENDKQLRQQLKKQSEAHLDHLQDALNLKESELKRNYNRELEDKLAAEKANYKLQLAAMVGKMRGMDAALQARAESERSAHQAQALWAACQALWATVRTGEPGVHWKDKLRPLKNEIRAISKVAEGDELVSVVLKNLPQEAEERGVFPEDALRERFLNVERVARKLALVPEEGSSLPIYLLSYLQSIFILKPKQQISRDELENKEYDYSQLDTYDILNRARYFIDRGDLTNALKYMNLLQGAPRKISSDWLKETRLLLETQQAANTLMAHAAASGLLYL